jgi:hypothetical protein
MDLIGEKRCPVAKIDVLDAGRLRIYRQPAKTGCDRERECGSLHVRPGFHLASHSLFDS